MIPRQPKEMMPKLWSLCDISLVNLRDAPLFKTVIPSKIFEAMGMGIPMIVSVPAGEATGIVEATNAGLIVPPESPSILAAEVSWLCDDKSLYMSLKSNATCAAEQYSRDTLAAMLESFAGACN